MSSLFDDLKQGLKEIYPTDFTKNKEA